MAKQPYYPRSKGSQIIWLNNHKAKIALEGPGLGLAAPEIVARQNACQAIIDAINLSNSMQQSMDEQYASEKAISSANTRIIFDGVARDKTAAGYTEAIGQDLGEVGDDDSFDLHGAVPELKLRQTAEGWKITFNLHGRFSSVNIERKRPGGNFAFLANDTSSPYIDTDPQVDGTEYRAIYLLGDVKMDNYGASAVVKL
jgi:hypothetical protein